MTTNEATERLLSDTKNAELIAENRAAAEASQRVADAVSDALKPGALGEHPAVVTGQGDYRREWPERQTSTLTDDMTKIRQRKVDVANAIDALADLSKQVSDVIGSLGRGVKYQTTSMYPHELRYLERDYQAAIAAVRKVLDNA